MQARPAGDPMTIRNKVLALIAGLGVIPASASAATIGGTFYAPQYDFSEFFAAIARPVATVPY
jgi:hypothetical protein